MLLLARSLRSALGRQNPVLTFLLRTSLQLRLHTPGRKDKDGSGGILSRVRTRGSLDKANISDIPGKDRSPDIPAKGRSPGKARSRGIHSTDRSRGIRDRGRIHNTLDKNDNPEWLPLFFAWSLCREQPENPDYPSL